MFGKRFLTATIVISIMLGLVVLGQAFVRPSSSSKTSDQQQRSQITGGLAIRPSSASKGITKSDVESYIQKTGITHAVGGSYISSFVQVILLSNGAVENLLATKTGLPSNKMLWFVEVRGKFIFLGLKGQTTSFPLGFEVFDASTGNLYLLGGLEK